MLSRIKRMNLLTLCVLGALGFVVLKAIISFIAAIMWPVLIGVVVVFFVSGVEWFRTRKYLQKVQRTVGLTLVRVTPETAQENRKRRRIRRRRRNRTQARIVQVVQ